MGHQHPQRRSRIAGAAFTLVELLVVITVIAVLAGMLMPAVSLVRESARLSQCQSNLRQCYLAAWVYVNENEGYIPPSVDFNTIGWTAPTAPIPINLEQNPNVSKIFVCPSIPGDQIATNNANNPTRPNRTYAANTLIMTFNQKLVNVATIVRPTEKILLADGGLVSGTFRGYFAGVNDVNWPCVNNPDNGIAYMGAYHKRRTSTVFVDGHTGQIVRSDVVVNTHLHPTR